MVRPMFFHPSHHILTLQKLPLHQSPLVKATFTVKGITFSGVAMLDSGCSTCIIPISQLPKEAKKYVTHSDVYIKGINGSITALGELHCNIIIGNCDSLIFEDINVLVTTQDTPILIGQNILAHNTLGSYMIDNQNATVEFRCTLTSGYTVHTALIIPASTLPHGPEAPIAQYSPYATKTGQAAWSSISKELSTRFLLISTHTQCLRSTTCSTGLAKETNILHHLISTAATGKWKLMSKIATKQHLHGKTNATSTHA